MFTNVNRIKILSRKPLWYIDEGGKIGYIQNVYSDAEQIQVIKDDHITNYPICKNLTVIPELNTVLFETEEDAQKRDTYLSAFDGSVMLCSGSHKVVGTVIIRTSNYLTATQQNDITTNIMNSLIALK